MKQTVGGVWNFTSKTPQEFIDKEGFSGESVYKEIDCLIQHNFMTFKDFPGKSENANGHLKGTEYEKYLNDYATHFDLMKYIKFGSIVKKATKN